MHYTNTWLANDYGNIRTAPLFSNVMLTKLLSGSMTEYMKCDAKFFDLAVLCSYLILCRCILLAVMGPSSSGLSIGKVYSTITKKRAHISNIDEIIVSIGSVGSLKAAVFYCLFKALWVQSPLSWHSHSSCLATVIYIIMVFAIKKWWNVPIWLLYVYYIIMSNW